MMACLESQTEDDTLLTPIQELGLGKFDEKHCCNGEVIACTSLILLQIVLQCACSSDSGRSKFLLKSAGPSHHQTSVSIYQKKAFGELYSTVMVGGCELKVYRSYAHFQFFPYKFQLNENTKVLGVC